MVTNVVPLNKSALLNLNERVNCFPKEDPFIRNRLLSRNCRSFEKITMLSRKHTLLNLTNPVSIIYRAYTNLITGKAEIIYETTDNGPVTIEIRTQDSTLVKTLIRNFQAGGVHKVEWVGDNDLGRTVENGLYNCVLTTGDNCMSKTVMLVR